jgi:hypothetical protein
MSSKKRRNPPNPEPSSSNHAEEWYEIKRIIAERKVRGTVEYKVEWEGLDPETDRPWAPTWVSAMPIVVCLATGQPSTTA